MEHLTEKETEFVERTRAEVNRFLKTRSEEDIDWGVGSFILSEEGNIYHGVPFGAARCIHGEENAVGSMVTEEGVDGRIRIVLIVGGSDEICMPCGMCRVVIYKYGTGNTAVLCANLSLSKVERFRMTELYPYPYEGEY